MEWLKFDTLYRLVYDSFESSKAVIHIEWRTFLYLNLSFYEYFPGQQQSFYTYIVIDIVISALL